MMNQSNRHKHLFVIALTLAGAMSLVALLSYSSRVTVKVTAQSVCVSPPSGLVGWWPGDGDAIDIQDSNSGTLLNGATFAPGKVGQAFSLNGVNAYVSAPFTQTGPFTVDFWAKANATNQTASTSLLSSSFPGHYDPFFQIDFDGSGNYRFNAGNGPPPVNIGQAKTSFQHIAVTYDGSTVKTYLDGQFSASGTWTGLPLRFEVLKIGINRDENRPFNGLIDEVDVFNRALSASEIQAIVHAYSAGKCKNRPPVAVCQSVTVSAGANCTANASINNGSSDPDGDPITLTQSPAGPYPLGNTTVTLTVTDNKGASSQCTATITVVDNTPPTITAPPAVTASTGSGATACGVTISDTTLGSATASDNCGSATITRSGVPAGNFFPVGTTTITYTAKDASGNTATATQSVTVNDTTPPIPDLSTLPDVTGQCSATISTTPTATDYCKGKIVGTTTDPLTYTSQGTFIVTWTFDDGNGNKSTQTQKVIVKDTTPPVPDLATLPDVTGQCSATISSVPTATDNCKGKITGTTTDPLTYTSQGTFIVTWTFDDGNGNKATQTQKVVVKDTTPPVPDVASLPTVTGQCSATVTAPTATDNCAGKITGTTADPLTYTTQGTFTVHWTYSDGNGNTSAQTQTVMVKDTTPPVPDVASLPTVTGECSATVTAPTAHDNCAGLITATTTDPTSYPSQGTFTIHWTYNDGNGNTATQTQTVIVHDTTPPVPNVATLPTISGECSATVTAPTATDNCAGTLTGTTVDPLTYTTQGTYTIHWTYSDGHGNTSTQTQTVIVKDTTPPVITLNGANSLTVECHTSFTDPGATASDNCAGNLTSSIVVTGSVNANAPGTYTLTYNVSDPAGNAATPVSRTVKVVDTTPPTITLNGANPLTVECHTSFADPGAMASDTCAGSLTVAVVSNNVNPNAVGSYTITYSATDPSGNTATKTRTVNVVDTTPPAIMLTGPNPMTVECHTSFTDPGATANDACAGPVAVTTSGSVNVNTPGTYTITYTASDSSGNKATQTRTVNVVDTTPPVITLNGANPMTIECHSSFVDPGATANDACAGSVAVTASGSVNVNAVGTYTLTYSASDGINTATKTRTVNVVDTTPPAITLNGANPLTVECHTSFTDPGATANDACAGPVAVTASGSVNANAVGTYTLTYSASDGTNTATKTRTVNVVDTTPPTITLVGASSLTVECHSSFVDPGASANDACAGSVPVISSGSVNLNTPGTYTLTYSATDPSGNTTLATRTVNVVDTTPPVITLAGSNPLTVECHTSFTDPGATANDACAGPVAVTASGSVNVNAVGSYTITYSATDGAHTATKPRTVSVVDTTPPVITLTGANPLTVECHGTFVDPGATANDACAGSVPVTASGSVNANTAGTYTITYSASDPSGNTVTATRTVNVVDTTPPSITLNGANPMTLECHSGFVDPGATASDVCAGNLTSAITVSGIVNANAVGSYTLTYTVSDGANTATATRTVKVVDTTPPSITAPPAVNATTGAGATSCGVVISDATLGTALASDNCSGVTITRSGVPAGNFFLVGITTIIYTATDASGNTATATQPVTVIDNTPPIITCPTNISVAGNILGSCSANVNPGTATATDNCAGVTVIGARSDGQALTAPYPLGTTTITWTATDAAGNRAACQQSVTVTNPNPVVTITGPPTGSIYAVNTPVSFTGAFTDNPGGTHTATWSFDTLTQTGTVNEATGAVSATYTFTTAGVYQVTLTVNDSCGGAGTANTVDGLTALVVIYDPNGGFVTGGGWINSPAGSYVANPSLTGKANFGFVSKYEPGAQVPTGQTEFQFKVANLNFHSTSYDWLVVAGARAQYKGTGTINGSGNYGFLLTAIDGQIQGGGGVDKFRIKIWDKNQGDVIVYDNQMGAGDDATPTTVLGGGSIVIHK